MTSEVKKESLMANVLDISLFYHYKFELKLNYSISFIDVVPFPSAVMKVCLDA